MNGVVACFLIALSWAVLLFMTMNPGVSVIEISSLEVRKAPVEEKRELSVVPVSVSVFYETLCPFSRQFITTRLLRDFLRAPRLMNLSLVPYGNAKTKVTEEGYEFTCQHGPKECQGNTIHSCAVELVGNQTWLLQLVACMMDDEEEPVRGGQRCAEELGIAWEPIVECAEGPLGGDLLWENGERTRAVRPRVRAVPTTALQGVPLSSRVAWTDLLGEVCRRFADPKPRECRQMRSQ